MMKQNISISIPKLAEVELAIEAKKEEVLALSRHAYIWKDDLRRAVESRDSIARDHIQVLKMLEQGEATEEQHRDIKQKLVKAESRVDLTAAIYDAAVELMSNLRREAEEMKENAYLDIIAQQKEKCRK